MYKLFDLKEMVSWDLKVNNTIAFKLFQLFSESRAIVLTAVG